jgi:peptide/nickel transport system substrate-binding protein
MSSDNKLLQVLGSPKTSRRDFIRYAVATGVTATVAGSMFDKARAATPQKGGSYIQALTGGGTKDVLDPAQTNDSYMINVGNQLRNNLTEMSPEGQLRSELAESWESSDAAKTWVFKLRKGVEFHNGKTMDANDVVASFNHHRGEDSQVGCHPASSSRFQGRQGRRRQRDVRPSKAPTPTGRSSSPTTT